LAPYRLLAVKISNFRKYKMAAAAILENREFATCQQRLNRKLAQWCRMGPLTVSAVKQFEFSKFRWRTAAILETVKSRYRLKRLIDFDEIWRDDAGPIYRKLLSIWLLYPVFIPDIFGGGET